MVRVSSTVYVVHLAGHEDAAVTTRCSSAMREYDTVDVGAINVFFRGLLCRPRVPSECGHLIDSLSAGPFTFILTSSGLYLVVKAYAFSLGYGAHVCFIARCSSGETVAPH